MTALIIGALSCAIWIYLLAARGGFWRTAQRDDTLGASVLTPVSWPRVVALVPARDEADTIDESLGSLLRQDYPGSLAVILVDDHSRDGTGTVARRAALAARAADRLTILSAPPLPVGWTGKLWALNQGVIHAAALPEPPELYLFADADLGFAPDALRSLVIRAEANGLALTSLMAKLRCESLAERALIPAFIFFFQMLYPFAWVNRANRRTAAAAGGCMLLRRAALNAAGGLEAIRGELIDDCALARRLKIRGPIWVGLTERVRSLRPYRSFGGIRSMIVRSAYAQLRFSPVLLTATVAGMALTYLAPPLLALGGTGLPRLLGAVAWAQMALALQPTLRLYRVSPWWAMALPAVAGAYLGLTLDSAYQQLRGRGGMWKGRAQGKMIRPDSPPGKNIV
jgi:hopene-associated glycosyltransferase HpnB